MQEDEAKASKVCGRETRALFGLSYACDGLR